MGEDNSSEQKIETLNIPQKSHNKHKATVIIAFILVALAVGAGGFCLGKFVFNDKPESADCSQTHTTNNPQATETKAFPTTQVQQILADKFNAKDIGQQGLFNHFYSNLDNFNEQAKLQYVVTQLYPQDRQGKEPTSCAQQGSAPVMVCQFDYAKINQEYQSYFGSFSNAPKGNFHYDAADMTDISYDAEQDRYTVNYGYGLGGVNPTQLFYKVISAQQQGDNVEAIVTVATTQGIVASEQPCSQSSNGRQIFYDAIVPESNIKEMYDSLATYKFVFMNDNGNYVLKEVANLKSES